MNNSNNIFNDINLVNPLPLHKQNKYLQLARQGDTEARNMIIKHNLKLIIKVLNTYFFHYKEEDKKELFSVGCIGLIKSVDYFDFTLGYAFSTYATSMIYGEIKTFFTKTLFS